MTFKQKLDNIALMGYVISIRFGKMWSVEGRPFNGYRVKVTDQIANGWIGEEDSLEKAVNIVYKKISDVPPKNRFI